MTKSRPLTRESKGGKNTYFLWKIKRNEKLQSRREFFKSAAKAALPVVGAVVLASLPIEGKAQFGYSCVGCADTCSGKCRGGCYGNCKGDCYNSCKGTCENVSYY